MKRTIAWLSVFMFVFLGCGKKAKGNESSLKEKENVVQASDMTAEKMAPKKEPGSQFQPLVIYADKGSQDNHFIPSGFMPDGK